MGIAGARNSGRGRWAEVAEVAERQHGVVSRVQLRTIGLTESAISHAAATGRLHAVFRAVFSVGYSGIGLPGRLLAATLATGEGSVVSHGAAAFFLGLSEFQPEEIDVIAPVQAGRKIGGIRRRFVPPPSAEEMTWRDGVPVTSPSRTIVDLAGSRRAESLSRIVEQASVLGVLEVGAIDRILAGPRRRGSPLLRCVLDDWRRYEPGTVTRSIMEARLLVLLTRHDLPIPECNARVVLGSRTYEIDFLWRRQRLVVETDGARFHDNPNAARRDKDRDAAFARAGYFVLRVGWEDLRSRSAQTMSEIAQLLRPSASAVP